MTENFKKFKTKYIAAAVLKSVVVGLCCGLYAAGIVMLAFKLSAVEFFWAYYLLIGAGVALVSGGIAFLVIRPTDRRIARSIDRKYGLNEKVQTMVSCYGQEGDMVALQREDTEEILATVLASKPQRGSAKQFLAGAVAALVSVWQYVVCAVIALALLISSLAVAPATKNSDATGGGNGETPVQPIGPDDGDGYEFGLVQESELDELILDVRESDLSEDTLKPAFLAVLEGLKESLKEVTTKTEMTMQVVGAISLIDAITDGANSYIPICTPLKEVNENFYYAIVDGATAYKGSLSLLTSLRGVKAAAVLVGDTIGEAFTSSLTEAVNDVLLTDNSDQGDKIKAFNTGLYMALRDSEVDKSDALYSCLETLRLGLSEVITSRVGVGGYSYSSNNSEIQKKFSTFQANAPEIIQAQSYVRIMDVYVRNRLIEIFGIKNGEVPALKDEGLSSSFGGGGDDDNPDPDGGNGNGSGSGNNEGNYNKNQEEVFDPETGERVKYIELLDRYSKRYAERIANGDYGYVSEYFSMLSSSGNVGSN